MSGTLFGCMAAIDRGVDAVVAASVALGGAILCIAVFERVLPFEPRWNRNHNDLRVDLIHNVVNALIPKVFELLAFGVLLSGAAWLVSKTGTPLWPTTWPIFAQLALALVIGEFGAYWIHRLTHEVPWLWRFHATHHSAPRLYWLNAARFHPIDLFAQHVAHVVPMILLGASIEVIALHTLFTAVHGLFQHSNIDVKLGPLNYIFSMSELHRWHHSTNVSEADHNYGANLIVWDIVFGTRYLPANRRPPSDIGIEALPDFPQTYTAQLLSPVQWTKITAQTNR